MKKNIYEGEKTKYVNFRIPERLISELDELAYRFAEGNRTKMLIKLIEVMKGLEKGVFD